MNQVTKRRARAKFFHVQVGRLTLQIADLSGQTYGKLHVDTFAGMTRAGAASWRCRCTCGRQTIAVAGLLRNGIADACPVCKAKATKANDAAKARRVASRQATHNRIRRTEANGRRKKG